MRRIALPKKLKVALVAIGGAGLAFTAFMGFAHTKPGRPLLALMGRPHGVALGGCPLGYDGKVSAADLEAGRRRQLEHVRGSARAAARPALGFSLEKTTRADVMAWATSHHVACTQQPAVSKLDCANVPIDALPGAYGLVPIDGLYLQFDPSDKLVSIGTMRTTPNAQLAVNLEMSVTEALRAEVGDPSEVTGESNADYLASGLLRSARSEFRYQNYFATATAANMGPSEFVVSEQYQAIPETLLPRCRLHAEPTGRRAL